MYEDKEITVKIKKSNVLTLRNNCKKKFLYMNFKLLFQRIVVNN